MGDCDAEPKDSAIDGDAVRDRIVRRDGAALGGSYGSYRSLLGDVAGECWAFSEAGRDEIMGIGVKDRAFSWRVSIAAKKSGSFKANH
jgi:hypothetical protein